MGNPLQKNKKNQNCKHQILFCRCQIRISNSKCGSGTATDNTVNYGIQIRNTIYLKKCRSYDALIKPLYWVMLITSKKGVTVLCGRMWSNSEMSSFSTANRFWSTADRDGRSPPGV